MKTYYLYELINLYGTIEYVGISSRPEIRFYEHTKKANKPYNTSSTCGLFYGRTDLQIHIVSAHETRKQAMLAEGALKIEYGMEWTERRSKNFSDESKAKMSRAKLGHTPWNKGLKLT